MLSKLLPLVSSFFINSKYKKDPIYLLAFTTAALLCLNYLKFANKIEILPFRNFDWLTRITYILDGGVYLKRVNEYLSFLLLFYFSKMKI